MLVRIKNNWVNRKGAVVRALASHQCVPGSIPAPGVICGLSLLLVLYSAPRGFLLGYSGFPLSSKTSICKFPFDPRMQGNFKRVLENSWCYAGKQITFTFTVTIERKRQARVRSGYKVLVTWSVRSVAFNSSYIKINREINLAFFLWNVAASWVSPVYDWL